MNIRFICLECEYPGRLVLPASRNWRCPSCDYLLTFKQADAGESLSSCLLCGNQELYKKKNFPHWLGMSILVVACLAFLMLNAVFSKWWAWTILLGSAIFDGLLYVWVPDVIVCYRCGAHYRGFPPNPEHKPFELGVGERYRQEKIRRKQLKEKT